MRGFSKPEITALNRRFISASPFPHVVIENFLLNHKQLLNNIQKERLIKKDTDLFSFSQTNNLFYSKNAAVKAAVAMFSSQQFSSLMSAITGINLKPGAVDVSASLYEKTDYVRSDKSCCTGECHLHRMSLLA